jgi:hypothetical protein
MADSIIQLNKTKLLKSVNLTENAVTTVVFATESDAVRLLGFAPAINGSMWWELYELGGSTNGLEHLIYRSETITAIIDPVSFTFAGGQLFKLVIHSTGTINFTVYATGITGAMAQLDYQTKKDLALESELLGAELAYRTQVVNHLHDMQYTLKLMLNHLRVVTEINDDKGEDF